MSERLLPDEELVAEVRRHWVVWMRPAALVVVLGPVLAGLALALDVGLLAGQTRVYLALGLVAISLLTAQAMYLGWRSVLYTLTDRRVILSRGLFSRFSRSIRLDRVQDVSTHQSLPGRVLGYGTVVLESAGASEGQEYLDHVPDPEWFRDAVFEHLGPRDPGTLAGESQRGPVP